MDAKRQVPSAEFRVLSEKIKSVCSIVFLLSTLFIAGCGTTKPGNLARVALLAPFEGRYREVGYNAYYAVKLALSDYGKTDIEFVAVDDGGSVQSAVDRARALAGDPRVKAVIALGYTATGAEVQQVFRDIPMLIVGDWGVKPETQNIFLFTNPQIDTLVTLPESERGVTDAGQLRTPFIGN
jgi:hypothetical protein